MVKQFTKNKNSIVNEIEESLFEDNNITITSKEDLKRVFPDVYDSEKSYNSVFSDILNSDKFVEIIKSFDINKTKICIYGDYDNDGIFGTVIMYIGLKSYGFKNIEFCIPDRLRHGYGIDEYIWTDELFKPMMNADLIITVDNGISSNKEVKKLEELGKTVIITDHHLPDGKTDFGNTLVIDPKYNNDRFQDICGATVAYKLIYKLLKSAGKIQYCNITALRALAGIATIADMMPLLDENRILVRETLKILDEMKELSKAGLNTRGFTSVSFSSKYFPIFKLVKNFVGNNNFLIDSKYNPKHATVEFISFYIAPAINAISRVEGNVIKATSDIIGSFYKKNYDVYFNVNKERKEVSESIYKTFTKSDTRFSEVFLCKDTDREIKGIIGLVANKIMNETNKISLVGREDKDKGIYDFSGRSLPGYNLFEGLTRICEEHPEFEIDFGGHALALALRMKINEKNLELFKECLESDIEKNSEIKDKNIYEYSNDNEDIILETLYKYKIFGQGFRNPTFIYTGILTQASKENKVISIGDYVFTSFLQDIPPLNSNVSVEFNINFDGNETNFKVVKIVDNTEL